MSPRTLALTIGSLLTVASAAATAAAPDQSLSVTIYAGDLALVQDHRTVNLTGGRQRLEFENVSAEIRPETVSLAARDLTIVGDVALSSTWFCCVRMSRLAKEMR